MEFNSYEARKKHVDAWLKYFETGQFNYFITVNPNAKKYADNKVMLSNLQSYFDNIQKYLEIKMFGKRFYKMKDTKDNYRIKFVGFPEHLDSNLHVHLKANVCEHKREIFEKYLLDAVKTQFPAGSIDVQYPPSKEDCSRTASYILKEQGKPENAKHMILSRGNKL